MKILITRPSPYGNHLTNQLNNMGKKAWHLPLITFSIGKNILSLKKNLNSLLPQDLIFITSQNAIHYAHTQLLKTNTPWPKIHYYTIGRTTALRFYSLTGIKAIYPTIQETSEELLKLPELNNTIQGKKALILCGNKARKKLNKTLQQRGIQVINCESYSRIPILYNGEKQAYYMIQIGIDTIVITSKEILQYLYNLIPNYYRKHWLIKCKIIVASYRIAKYAKTLGWKHITITKTTQNNDIINTLSQI